MTGQYVHRQAVYRLVVDGIDIGAQVTPRVISLDLTEKRGADADELAIALSDQDGQLAVPPTGAIITLSLGWRELGSAAPPQLFDKGSFKVDQRRHAGTPGRRYVTAEAFGAGIVARFEKKKRTERKQNL